MGTYGTLPCRFQMGQKVSVAPEVVGDEMFEGVVVAVYFFNDGRVEYNVDGHIQEYDMNGNLFWNTLSEINIDQLRITAIGGNHDTRVADHQRTVEKRASRDEQRRKDGYTGMSKRNGS